MNITLQQNNVRQQPVQEEKSFWTRAKEYAMSLFSEIADFFSGEDDAKPAKTTEIPLIRDISDEQIMQQNTRSKYLSVTKNPNYKIQKGDNISKIAAKFGVQPAAVMAVNGLDEKSAVKIRAGQSLKIPPTRTPKNINTLKDVAKSMGVSNEFILGIKRIEDGKELKDTQFHNTPYNDKGKTKTIGIGHVWKEGEPEYLNNKQVLEQFAKDLIKAEDHLRVLMGGEKNYDKLPASLKEALLDMTFNKGTDIIKNTEGLLWCLKNGKYEAAICKMTNNVSAATKQPMSGLSKRRLFDMATASKMYNGNIPKSITNTAQRVYNDGIRLLRLEYPDKTEFAAQLADYNRDVKSFWGSKVKLITK